MTGLKRKISYFENERQRHSNWESTNKRFLHLVDVHPGEIGKSVLFNELAATIALKECLAIDPNYAAYPLYSSTLSHSRSLLCHLCQLGAALELIQFTFRAHPDAACNFHPEDECCTALYAACSARSPCWEVIKFLLLVQDISLLSACNFVGRTALTALLLNPRVSIETVKLFYEWDHSLFKHRTDDGLTSLHIVCSSGAGYAVIEFILDKFPEMMAIGCHALGFTPLHLSLSTPCIRDDIITLLAEKCPFAIAQCATKQGGLSPLSMACSNMETAPEVIDTLVANYPFQDMQLLGASNVSPTTVRSLFHGMNFNCSIITLSVFNCSLSENASVALFDCLSKNDTLTIVLFDSTSITWTDLVIEYIKRFLTENSTIRALVFPPSTCHTFGPDMSEGRSLNAVVELMDAAGRGRDLDFTGCDSALDFNANHFETISEPSLDGSSSIDEEIQYYCTFNQTI